jgi:signal peptidase I
VAERQPGSPEPADDPRTPASAPPRGSSPALADAWAATPEGMTGGLRRPPNGEPRDGGASAAAPSGTEDAAVDPPSADPDPRAASATDRATDDVGAPGAPSDDGARGLPPHGSADRGGVLSFLRELPVLVILAFALALLLKTFVVQAFYIPSGSMEPTLMPGDRVLVEKVLYHPSRGDIIVFQDPNPGSEPDRGIVGGFLHWLSQGLGFSQPVDEDFIKRVIGLPGDTVELRHGKLYVNGTRVAEPYLHGEPDLRDYGPKTVPPDSLFMLGDNRLNSNDSRFGLGFVPEDRVIGKAFVVIWPPTRIGWLR